MDEQTRAHHIQAFFDAMPEKATFEPFSNARGYGFIIAWALPGIGFGEFTVAFNRARQQWTVDDETMGDESLARIFACVAAKKDPA